MVVFSVCAIALLWSLTNAARASGSVNARVHRLEAQLLRETGGFYHRKLNKDKEGPVPSKKGTKKGTPPGIGEGMSMPSTKRTKKGTLLEIAQGMSMPDIDIPTSTNAPSARPKAATVAPTIFDTGGSNGEGTAAPTLWIPPVGGGIGGKKSQAPSGGKKHNGGGKKSGGGKKWHEVKGGKKSGDAKKGKTKAAAKSSTSQGTKSSSATTAATNSKGELSPLIAADEVNSGVGLKSEWLATAAAAVAAFVW